MKRLTKQALSNTLKTMSETDAKEESVQPAKVALRMRLSELLRSLAPELVVGVLAFLCTRGLGFFKWYYEIGIPLLVSLLYRWHNKAMLDKWEKRAEKGSKGLADNLGTLSKETIPMFRMSLLKLAKTLTKDTVTTMYRFKSFRTLGNTIARAVPACDPEIIDWVLKDQTSLLQNQEHVLTLKAYLDLLKKFGGTYEKLYCVNSTLPIFWFSPHPRDRDFVGPYAEDIVKQPIMVHRLTVVETAGELRTQFEDAFDEIRVKYETLDLLLWCLVLLQQLFDTSSELPSFIIEIIENKIDNEPFRQKIKTIVFDSDNREGIELGILEEISDKDRDDLVRGIFAMRGSSDHCKKINRIIVERFVYKHKKEGAYYGTKGTVVHALEALISIHDYGELGVYINAGKPAKAFATIGEFGSLIKIKSMPQDQVYTSLKALFTKAVKVGVGAIGNMASLYANG